MLYSEFINGTNCKDTEQNYNIYKGLELIYMNSDISKDEVYKMGKRLVNNDLTPEQKAHNAEIQEQIEELEQEIVNMQFWLDRTPYSDKQSIKYYEREIKAKKLSIKTLKSLIAYEREIRNKSK